MSILEDYDRQTAWKYESIRGTFHTAESLVSKVGPDGCFVPFHGSTVVFRADKTCLRVIGMMQDLLYQDLRGSGMLAERLPVSTVHMTLHDLLSPEAGISGTAEERSGRILESVLRAGEIVDSVVRDLAGQRIHMVPDRIVNMVSKSLVLLLRPQTDEDFETLTEIYRRFDCIRPLPYPLTPHITLAYYTPGTLDGDRLGRTVDRIQADPENAPVFCFYPESLTAQVFSDMRTYLDVPLRLCFCCDGGLMRSVMAANILNSLAAKRGLDVRGEARSAHPSSQGWPVPDEVWKTLEDHGVPPDRTYASARYLEEKEVPRFSLFAAISEGAADRFYSLCVPDDKALPISRIFQGVRDPEYTRATLEETFEDLYSRTEKAMDLIENDFAKMKGR
ncbi:MAG: hypothetical protein IKI84_10045 [Clostridia bacterium]|nr:hypothetical protein [Clostridia bacterium]